MATKHGQDAITAWAKIQAATKAKRNAIFLMVSLVVVGLELNYYVF